MTNTVQTYLNLITSEHQNKPNFVATISLTVQPQVQIQDLMLKLIGCFDIDDTINCVGVFLDMVGEWAGITRNVKTPITGVYFTWGGTDPSVGWDAGTWESPFDPGGITVLPDDAYRTLIKAKIAANQWDGTTEGAYAIWAILFPTLPILIQDNQDMTMSIGFIGLDIPALTIALITGGYIQLKPEGVGIREYFFQADTNPFFAWGTESTYLGGWGTGSWAIEEPPT